MIYLLLGILTFWTLGAVVILGVYYSQLRHDLDRLNQLIVDIRKVLS